MGKYKISDAVRRGALAKFSQNTASLLESYFGPELPDCEPQTGQCIDFNGVDQYATLSLTDTPTRFNGAKYLTFGGLFYHRGAGVVQRIITHSTGFPMYLDIRSNDKMTLVATTRFNDGATTQTASMDLNGTTLTRNTWNDLRIVIDCINRTVTAFVNGTQADQTWPSAWGTAYKDHVIHCPTNSPPRFGSSTSSIYWYNGFMSMVYMTPEALDASAHGAVVFRGQKRLPNSLGWVMPLNESNPSLVSTNRWRLWDGTGTIQGDLYNTSSTGTSFINGRFARRGVAQPNRMGIATVFGYPEQWGNVVLPTPTIGAGDFSFQFWAKLPSTATNSVNYILSAYGNNGDYMIAYTVRSAQTFRLNFSLGGVSATRIVSGFTLDTWHHIAVTVDRDGNMVIYLDGVASDTVAVSTANFGLLTQAWYLGTPPTQVNQTNGVLITGYAITPGTSWRADQISPILNLMKRN